MRWLCLEVKLSLFSSGFISSGCSSICFVVGSSSDELSSSSILFTCLTGSHASYFLEVICFRIELCFVVVFWFFFAGNIFHGRSNSISLLFLASFNHAILRSKESVSPLCFCCGLRVLLPSFLFDSFSYIVLGILLTI